MPSGLKVFVALLVWVGAGIASAQSRVPVPKYEENPFVEQEAALPEFPVASGLVEFPVDGPMRVLIDRGSLQLGADQVVRYTLVVRSPSGAETISREGVRCAKPEFRVYAYGRRTGDSGTWSPARGDDWRRIYGADARFRFELWRDVFCNGVIPESLINMHALLVRGGRQTR